MASLTLAFFLFFIQYFQINKGISVTFDFSFFFFFLSCLFNNFGLKCLLPSTNMHEIDYTFLFLSFFSFFFPQSNLGVWVEGGALHMDICYMLSKVNNQLHLISNLSHMLCRHHHKYKKI